MLRANEPALILAPMDGITDAPMRALQGESGAFSFAVSEFIRVASEPIPAKVFRRDVPELENGARTCTGLPVQVQILGGNSDRMATSAATACRAGATAIDINFGCPAPVVNRHDGGAMLLNHPCRIREIVGAVRSAVPKHIPVSAKLRLGWDNIEDVYRNASMAAEGGADWIAIHARTRVQGYTPPVFWKPLGKVRAEIGVPVVANGDIWNFEDFLRCRDESGCSHFMLGRGALADPALPRRIARELGTRACAGSTPDWIALLRRLSHFGCLYADGASKRTLMRLKQWLKLAANFGDFPHFDRVKQTQTEDEFFDCLSQALS